MPRGWVLVSPGECFSLPGWAAGACVGSLWDPRVAGVSPQRHMEVAGVQGTRKCPGSPQAPASRRCSGRRAGAGATRPSTRAGRRATTAVTRAGEDGAFIGPSLFLGPRRLIQMDGDGKAKDVQPIKIRWLHRKFLLRSCGCIIEKLQKVAFGQICVLFHRLLSSGRSLGNTETRGGRKGKGGIGRHHQYPC